jgi:hydrogenase maturation factor
LKLEIGKIPNDLLEKLLENYAEPKRSEVLSRPMVGEDCAVLDFAGDLCVVTTDPITGADDETGTLAVHIACNDLASAGAEPVGLMVTILAPVNTELENIEKLMKQVYDAASGINAGIIGGHTEVTDAVNRLVVSITALGRVKRDRLVTAHGARPGDSIILTNYAATEGTVILAYLFENELSREFGSDFAKTAKNLLSSVSVVKEGLFAAQYGVTCMHDVTEGGVLGACWEIGKACGYGIEIEKRRIPILEETRRICHFLSLDPLKLISSGCMLITTPNGEEILKLLHRQDIKASIIGQVTFEKEFIMVDEGSRVKISAPGSDELYRARKMKGMV